VKAITTKGARQRQILLAMHSNNSMLWLTMELHGMTRASFIFLSLVRLTATNPGHTNKLQKQKGLSRISRTELAAACGHAPLDHVGAGD